MVCSLFLEGTEEVNIRFGAVLIQIGEVFESEGSTIVHECFDFIYFLCCFVSIGGSSLFHCGNPIGKILLSNFSVINTLTEEGLDILFINFLDGSGLVGIFDCHYIHAFQNDSLLIRV